MAITFGFSVIIGGRYRLIVKCNDAGGSNQRVGVTGVKWAHELACSRIRLRYFTAKRVSPTARSKPDFASGVTRVPGQEAYVMVSFLYQMAAAAISRGGLQGW